MSANRHIGIIIESILTNRNISQMELARRIGMDKSVLNRIISGERRARDNELIALSKELAITADELLGIGVPAAPAKETEANQMKTVAKVLCFQTSVCSTRDLADEIIITVNKTIAEMEKRNYHLLSTNVNAIEINPHNNGGGAYVTDLVYTLMFRFGLHM